MDANARKLVGRGHGEEAAVKKLLQADKLAWDPKSKLLVGTESHLKMDEAVRPNEKSAIFENSVEQCMEFAMRYFRDVRKKLGAKHGGFGQDWTLQINPAAEFAAIADGKAAKAGYTAFRNGSTTPPRAGDVLSLQSPLKGDGSPPRHFHIAMISDVYKKGRAWFVRCYEANVPRQTRFADVKKHYNDLPVKVVDGKFTIGRVPTSQRGYTTDMDVVAWLHPLSERALPGAAAEGVKTAGHGRVGVLK